MIDSSDIDRLREIRDRTEAHWKAACAARRAADKVRAEAHEMHCEACVEYITAWRAAREEATP